MVKDDPIMDKLSKGIERMLDDVCAERNTDSVANENGEVVNLSDRIKALSCAMQFVTLRDKVQTDDEEKSGLDELRNQLHTPPPGRGNSHKSKGGEARGSAERGPIEFPRTSFAGTSG